MAETKDGKTGPAGVADLGFDPAALKARYRAERDKRLRDDANEQYVEIKGKFAHYLEDPYVEPGFAREPLSDEVDVVVIGGGFGGLLAGARLREAGIENIRMIEKGGDFGGTWYWNRYPGAACDIESYIYLPLLEEIGYMPVEKYSKAAEILAHSQAIGRHFDLYRDALFQTEVTGLHWNDEISRWIIRTNRDDAIKARFVVTASGPLHRPKLPGIPGIESFKGHTFHTSRWDYAYTGGDCNGGLDRLRDKRVGIIGTGATAVQCVPHLGAWAKELFVFQPAEMAEVVQLADFQKMESIRKRVETVVRDPAKAEALKPWYNQFCKRPCFHDEYLATFNRPNVHLVDTQGRGVEQIGEHSVFANGEEFEVDCLIYATGFEVGTGYTRRAGFEIYGRDGITLTDKWKDGISSLHGMHTHGFPNCFIVSNAQAGFTANFPHMLNEQSRHLAYIVKECIDRQARVVEATRPAEEAWVEEIVKASAFNRRYLEECTPGYYNNEGKPSELAIRNGFYGGGSIAFIRILEDWRATGDLPGLKMH